MTAVTLTELIVWTRWGTLRIPMWMDISFLYEFFFTQNIYAILSLKDRSLYIDPVLGFVLDLVQLVGGLLTAQEVFKENKTK